MGNLELRANLSRKPEPSCLGNSLSHCAWSDDDTLAFTAFRSLQAYSTSIGLLLSTDGRKAPSILSAK